jgi:hypothetical protein
MSDNKATPIGRLMLKNVRLAFPNLFTPTTVGGEGEPRYSAMLILPPDHPQLKELETKMKAVAKDKWKDKAAATYTALEKTDKLALHDGDTKAQYDGVAGNMFISAAAQQSARPTVIGKDRSPLTEKDGVVYAGCYVNVSIDLWPQDNKYGKRINAQLRGVQFVRDGDAFAAGRPADSDEFEDVAEGSDAGDFA